MNVNEYILSGVLEEYVLGTLPTEEALEVERMAAQYPEVKMALEELEGSFDAYNKTFSVAPPPDLKERIWQRIQAEDPKVISIAPEKKSSSRSKWLAAASIALLIVSGIFNIILYSNLKQTKDRLATLESEKVYMASELNTLKANYDRSKEALALASSPENKTVRLAGVKNKSILATVYYNASSGQAYLLPGTLPATEPGKQYQLWALVDGKPVDMGVLDSSFALDKAYQMKNVHNAQAFAITIEKEGGSPGPTLETMIVLGKVEASS